MGSNYVWTEKHASYVDINFLQFIVDNLLCDLLLLGQFSSLFSKDEKWPRTLEPDRKLVSGN